MIGIGPAFKWGAILIIVSLLAKGVSMGWEAHLDAIDMAVNDAKKTLVLEQNEFRKEREDVLRETSKVEKEIIEAELKIERNRVSSLQRMLFVDHDLDKLLQKKPGLILIRVNAGTEEYYKELEEITQ